MRLLGQAPRKQITGTNVINNKNAEEIMEDVTQGKYRHEISRKYPGCFIFLIDQSESMDDLFFSRDTQRKKAEGAADALNRLLSGLILRSTKNDGIRDYFHIGVIGYGATVGPAFSGELAGRDIVPISDLDMNKSIEKRERQIEDGAGGLIKEQIEFPTWFNAVAKNGTPMCQALSITYGVINNWIKEHPDCFPPIVINITDGESTDGNPLEAANNIKKLATTDGNVLLFNCHLSTDNKPSVLYPKAETEVSFNEFATLLFNISSVLPPNLAEVAKKEISEIAIGSHGFVFNASLVELIKFIDIGTRTPNLR
jgi:hypothetical protein